MDFRIEQAAKEQKAGEGCGQRRDRPNRELANRVEDEGGHEHEDAQEGYAERQQVEKMSPHAGMVRAAGGAAQPDVPPRAGRFTKTPADGCQRASVVREQALLSTGGS